MSYRDRQQKIQWMWYNGTQWQSFDPETNEQIESGHIGNVAYVSLTKGPFFGKYQKSHRVYFKYTSNEATFLMINIYTKDIIKLERRIILNKLIAPITQNTPIISNINHKNNNNHQNNINNNNNNNINGNIQKANIIKKTPLSALKIIQIYKKLYNSGYDKPSIDKAIKIFNNKYNKCNQNFNEILNILSNIINNYQSQSPTSSSSDNIDNIPSDNEQDEQEYIYNDSSSTTYNSSYNSLHNNESNIKFEIGELIQILINNNWISAKIINIDMNTKHFFVEYQKNNQNNNKQLIQIKLHQIRHKHKFRSIILDKNQNNNDNKMNKMNKNRFNIISGYNININNNNCNKLLPQKFNFSYHKKNKKNDVKNAKHPSEYINRKCYKCRTSFSPCRQPLRRNILNNRNNNNNSNKCACCCSLGFTYLSCLSCIDSSGIYTKKMSLIHNQCNGIGCFRCANTGKYPLHNKKCNQCNGTGQYKIKCKICCNNNNNNSSSYINFSNRCISGYRLPKIVAYYPKRDSCLNIGVYGIDGEEMEGMYNMMRLYHCTDINGYNDIISTGLINKGNTLKSKINGIYFTNNARDAQIKSNQKNKGYLVIADVFTGKFKEEYVKPSLNINFDKLHSMGYDSIKGYWNKNAIEYVVYNWDQVWCHIVLPVEQINFDTL